MFEVIECFEEANLCMANYSIIVFMKMLEPQVGAEFSIISRQKVLDQIVCKVIE
jgi:hypothetical protein